MASSPAEVVGTSFSFYSAEEIRALSVKRVTQPLAFDSLNNPVLGYALRAPRVVRRLHARR